MRSAPHTAPLVALLGLAACSSPTALRVEDGLAADTLELAVDRSGHPTEIEYHVPPSAVPEAVHAAMDALHPTGVTVAAEKEYEGTTLYWELAKEVGGYKVEAMFHPDGTLHSQEVEVAATAVPAAVRDAVARAGYGDVRAWEEIHDGDQVLVEYHAKTILADRHYKLLLSTEGELLSVFREVVAEIELPVE